MITKRTKLFLFIIAAILLFSACGQGGSITVITSSPTPSPSPSPAGISPPPSEVPSPPPTETLDPLGAYISQMSDRELIGQLVMVGFDGTNSMASGSVKLIQEYSVGNIMLYGWNTDTFSQTKKLVKNVNSKNLSEIPLLVGIDLEGGSVTRFKGQWHPFISSAQTLGKANDPKRVFDQYKRIGEKLKDMGININFAPVLDIARNPSSTFLGKRMFGSNPDKVSRLVVEAVRGLHEAGVASLGKHFPGHGDTATDSHDKLPVLKATLEEMENYSLIPFKEAIDAGIDAMLVAHLSYPNVDSEYITSVSPAIITGILREDMGFNGVVFSDDLRMKGFTSQHSMGEGAVLHILAGGDVLLIGKYPDKQKAVLDSLYAALQDGTLSRSRLEQSVRRILELKIKYAGFMING